MSLEKSSLRDKFNLAENSMSFGIKPVNKIIEKTKPMIHKKVSTEIPKTHLLLQKCESEVINWRKSSSDLQNREEQVKKAFDNAIRLLEEMICVFFNCPHICFRFQILENNSVCNKAIIDLCHLFQELIEIGTCSLYVEKICFESFGPQFYLDITCDDRDPSLCRAVNAINRTGAKLNADETTLPICSYKFINKKSKGIVITHNEIRLKTRIDQ